MQRWRLPNGAVWAYACRLDGVRWLQLPGLATFRLDGAAVTAFPDAGVPEEAVRDAFRRIVLPIAFQARGGEVFHASAVRVARGVVAFCADSGGGKSTIAFALSQRGGNRLWADDAVALDFFGGGVSSVMLPFVLRLRPPSARFFFGADRTADYRPDWLDAPEEQNPRSPLVGVFFLEREPDTRARAAPLVIPVAPTDAFQRVLPQAGCFTLQDPERKGLMLRRYLELSASVPFYALQVPNELERLDEALDRIDEALRP